MRTWNSSSAITSVGISRRNEQTASPSQARVRRQAGGALDAAVVPPLPGVQPGQSGAAARPANADRYVVAHQSPAAPRQDGRTAGHARPLLLAPAGREPPDAPVRRDAPADLGAPGANRLRDDGGRRPF